MFKYYKKSQKWRVLMLHATYVTTKVTHFDHARHDLSKPVTYTNFIGDVLAHQLYEIYRWQAINVARQL